MAIDINQLALLGVSAVIIIMILGILAQIGLSYLAQRNLNDQLSLGVQAITGTNNLRTIDKQMDDGDGK
jgi:Trp operon repressor